MLFRRLILRACAPLKSQQFENLEKSLAQGRSRALIQMASGGARLITGIYGDKKLQQMYLERFYQPRRQIQLRVIEEAIACRELKPDTDPELLLDALSGPMFFRWLQGHAPVDKKFVEVLADKIIPALGPKETIAFRERRDVKTFKKTRRTAVTLLLRRASTL